MLILSPYSIQSGSIFSILSNTISYLGVLYKVYGIGDDRYDYRYFTGPNRTGATKGKYYQGVPTEKLNEENMTKELPINGFFDFAANFGNCRHEGGVEFRGGKKPEILLKMIYTHFSKPGDWVIDSFLGSGSSAAVAHKMGRKWIGVELGEHAYSLCKKRIDSVIDGDQTGISKEVGWQGGGGYKFYELAEPLLVKNKSLPVYQINPSYTWDMVCEAICKIEGFTYEPSGEFQGHSSENRFIHITEEFVNTKYGIKLHERRKSIVYKYCIDNQLEQVKPIVLIACKDTTHARKIKEKIDSDAFFGGRYVGKVIEIDSSTSGAETEENIQKLLTIEKNTNPIEIVLHVYKLKEGWDVNNLFTIIPLNAAKSDILALQTIGRGLRLPFGEITGIEELDTLDIVAHDHYREIVDDIKNREIRIAYTY